MRCPNCQIEMESGFMVDRSGEHDLRKALWSSGEYWSYMLGQTTVLPVSTYRCANCGILQSYAGGPSEEPGDA